jgi:hypothetical protein
MSRETDEGGFLTSISVIGEGLLHQARSMKLSGMDEWTAIQAGGVNPLRK